MVLPFVPLSLPTSHPPQPQPQPQKMKERERGGGDWAGGGGKRTQPRHKVVFDLHLQHLALHQLPSMSSTAKGSVRQQRGGGGGKGERDRMDVKDSSSTLSSQLPTLPEALLWQGSETRGALKFRLRLRSPPSICLLLDDSHHEIVIPLSNITSLQLLDAPNANGNTTTKEGEDTNDQKQKQPKVGSDEESLEEMERRLRLGGMVLELGLVQGCQKDFRLREPNRYVRLSSLSGSTRVAAGDGTVEEGDFTGGAAKLTNLVRMTIHSTVTPELTTAMTSLVVRALKVRDGQAVDLTVFGGHLTHNEQMGGPVPSSGSGLFPMDSNTSGTESEESDVSLNEGKREPVVLFVKKGGVGLPRYRVAEEEEVKSSKKRSSSVEEKGKQQSIQIVVEEETSSPVAMVFEEDESRSTSTSHPLPLRPSPPTEPRQRSVTQPTPPTTRPSNLLTRQTIQDNVVLIDNARPPPASKHPIVVASLGSSGLSHSEYTNAHARLATTPLSIFDARFLSNQINNSGNPPSTPISSLPSTQKHRRTSIATLVLPPSPPLSHANPTLSSSTSPAQQLHQRASTVPLGAIGDSRPTHRLPDASSRSRSVTDGSLLASAVARASAKALERGNASSSPTSPTTEDGFGSRDVGGEFVQVGRQPRPRRRTPTTTSSSSSNFPPLDRIFSEGGSFAYQYPSPMSTPSSTCLSLSEEENDQFDEGRIRISSFASSSTSEEGAWSGRGRGLGSGRSLGGRGIVESGRSIWREREGGGGPNNKDSDASVWGAAAGRGVTRFASSSFFSNTNSNTQEEDFYPTPTPTYAIYSSSSSHPSERRRSSLPLNELRSSSVNFPLPATPPSPCPLPHQHLPSFLRGSTPDFDFDSDPSPNDAFGRTRSISTTTNSSSLVALQRPTTPRPPTRSQPLPPPPSTLLRGGDQKPVLPFYQLIDPRGAGGGTGRVGASNSSVHSTWVSSSS